MSLPFLRIWLFFDQLLKWSKLPAHLLHIEISEDQPLDHASLVTFRLDVCAEGVESVDQHQDLKKAGCTSVQGFLIGQKLSTQDLRKFLATYQEGHWIGNF